MRRIPDIFFYICTKCITMHASLADLQSYTGYFSVKSLNWGGRQAGRQASGFALLGSRPSWTSIRGTLGSISRWPNTYLASVGFDQNNSKQVDKHRLWSSIKILHSSKILASPDLKPRQQLTSGAQVISSHGGLSMPPQKDVTGLQKEGCVCVEQKQMWVLYCPAHLPWEPHILEIQNRSRRYKSNLIFCTWCVWWDAWEK